MAAVEYREMPTIGSSRATVAGRTSAMVHCDSFCLKKQIGLDTRGNASSDRLSEEIICQQSFFKELATYLCEHAISKTTGLLLKGTTAMQYLSAAKEFAHNKFPNNPLWIERSLDQWYPYLRVAVDRNCRRRQIATGQPISESSLALGRTILTAVSETFMQCGSAESMKRRLAILMTFHAVGRAGESACSTWTSAVWDRDLGNLLINWNELKTGKIVVFASREIFFYKFCFSMILGDSDPMNFFSDVSSMDIDFYHAMACYLIMGGGNAKLSRGEESNWIFPDLARNKDSASSLVTKYIREALADCPDKSLSGCSQDYEGTSLR